MVEAEGGMAPRGEPPAGPPDLDRSADSPDSDETGPVGPFASWRWVYGTVLVYGTLMILALWVLTRILDPGLGR